jgi:sterol desaturase/sphingolipid hydroxylase (fatty acid hydroxylase superfamily)
MLELIALLAIPGLFVTFIALERLWPARPMPKVSLWKMKGVLFFITTVMLSIFLSIVFLEALGAHPLLDLGWTGTVGGAVIAVLGINLVGYGWHRLMHNTPFLWRWFHQMHHSAERMDIYGAYYFHPLDVVGFAAVQTLVPFVLLGVSAEAGLIAGIVGTFTGLFQHANIKTPRWLGYIVQRPESHSVHHGRGIHAHNYSDLPVWDMLFGTFRNPEGFEAEAGYWDGASKKIGSMLVGRDVATPPAGAPVTALPARPTGAPASRAA